MPTATSATEAIAGLAKLCLNVRLLALLATIVWLPSGEGRMAIVGPLLAAVAATSFIPVMVWDRVAGWLLRHPTALVPDLLLACLILALVGLDTPFGLFVISTALLSGVLYGWVGAGVMSVALLFVYVGATLLAATQPSAAEVLSTPLLVPIAAAGGAAVRLLVIEQHRTSEALSEAMLRYSAATERSRLAREMHDTLTKTLQGISLGAGALPQLLETAPEAAHRTAASLAETADRAAQEARALIVDLRADELDCPLGEVVEETVRSWSARTGASVDVATDPEAELSPSTRYELLSILRESLLNAEHHGRADHVDVQLRSEDDLTWLTVSDDGAGFDVPELGSLPERGHFGVIGMLERARSVGGDLQIRSAPRRGTVVEAQVPTVASRQLPDTQVADSGARS